MKWQVPQKEEVGFIRASNLSREKTLDDIGPELPGLKHFNQSTFLAVETFFLFLFSQFFYKIML